MTSSLDSQNLDETTRYRAAKELLRHKVLSGEVGHGEQLQTELELCRVTNLSRTTMRKAIADLVKEGLLVRFRGRGTFVNFDRSPVQKKLLALLVCQYSGGAGAYDVLIRGAQEAASELGYKLMLANSQNDAGAALTQAVSLNEHKVAGTILVPLQTPLSDANNARVVHALRQAGQQVVMVDEFSDDASLTSVCSQNREAMQALTNHLIARGYQRIAFLTSVRTEVVQEREEGFLAAMKERGLPVPPEYFLEVGSRDPARQGIQEMDVLMALRTPPQAVICLHDLIALNALKRCEERGWKVPADVAIVGFDDLPASASSRPPLTTVHQPLMEAGRRAVELLVRQLKGEELINHHERLPCQLIERGSVGDTVSPGS
ncbi:MAG: GntR family transcriptional regulator [Opitutaceae bacterium]